MRGDVGGTKKVKRGGEALTLAGHVIKHQVIGAKPQPAAPSDERIVAEWYEDHQGMWCMTGGYGRRGSVTPVCMFT